MNKKNVFHGDSPFVRKPVTNNYDAQDLQNRLTNYIDCVNNFFQLYPTTEQLSRELNQIHTQSMCHKERLDLINFGKKTGFSFDSIFSNNIQ